MTMLVGGGRGQALGIRPVVEQGMGLVAGCVPTPREAQVGFGGLWGRLVDTGGHQWASMGVEDALTWR